MGFLGHYLFLAAGGYFTGLLCISLAVLVLHANPKSKSCCMSAMMNFSIALWSCFYATMYLVPDEYWGRIVSQLLTVGTICLSLCFSHLSLLLTEDHKYRRVILGAFYIGTCLLITLVLFTRTIIASVTPILDLPAYTDAGPLYILVPIHLFSNVAYGSILLIRGIRKYHGFRRSNLILFLVAAWAGFAVGTPAFLLVMDVPVKPITTPFVALFPILLTYGIIKHRLLDIQKLLKNGLIFGLLFVFMLGVVSIALFLFKEVFAKLLGMNALLSQGLAIALAIGLYGPLKSFLSRTTNRILFQHRKDPETVFQSLTKDILQYLDYAQLSKVVVERIQEHLALEQVGFYVRDRQNATRFEVQSMAGNLPPLFTTGQACIKHLIQSQSPLVNMQDDLRSAASRELAALSCVGIFPVWIGDRLKAFTLAGQKKSDDPWKEEEIGILQSFSRHLSLAVENAETAQKIRLSRHQLARNERDAFAGALISGVEHEVKNPLHTMSLSLSAVRDALNRQKAEEPIRPQQLDLTGKIMQSVLEDVYLVNEIIQHLSDLANRKPLKIEQSVYPYEIADKVIASLAGEEKNARIRVDNHIPDDLTLATDPNGLYEILTNLLRNACQAVENHGQVVMTAESNPGQVTLQIKDTGPGIPEQLQPRIFEPFFSTKGRKGGAGMGLFIVREYMQALNGTVQINSAAGQGTVFSLGFPVYGHNLEEAA
ncbi:ATP-binding protein [Omnitrophica bacterium]|nr:ATP-binding protein [Candidatus Omnitrophota bacterium]